MKELNLIIIGILESNQAKLEGLQVLTDMCSPARLFMLDSIKTETTIAKSIFDVMVTLASGRELTVVNTFRGIVDNRYSQIKININKSISKKCPHISHSGYQYFIREGIEKNLKEHKKMQKHFK